jgi:four helix bundle protein
MTSQELESRTRAFAVQTLRMCDALPNRRSIYNVANQLSRSASSVGANYRAALRGRSRAEFIAKLHIVMEESDECVYWLQIIAELLATPPSGLEQLLIEARQLTAIFTATLKTTKANSTRALIRQRS